MIRPIKITLNRPFKAGGGNAEIQRLRAAAIALGVRCALAMGYIVVITGGPCTGKSFILERAVRGRVISKKDEVLQATTRTRPTIMTSDIPRGTFGIDEAQLFDPQALGQLLHDVSQQYVIACQRSVDLSARGIDDALGSRHRVELILAG